MSVLSECWCVRCRGGALLHAHFNATVDVNLILEQEAFYVRASAPLTALSPTANVPPEFSPFPKFEVKLSATNDLTDASYNGEWIPVEAASENFSPEFGGLERPDKWYVA